MPSSALSQDYPAGYLGPGYREYLDNKIKYGYDIEIFTALENRQKERINKKNQIEEMVSDSYQAGSSSAYEIQESQTEKIENARILNTEIAQQRIQRLQVASAQTEFNYVKHSDGKTVYSQDGLTRRIENERVVDEFGNLIIKDTHNMQYNDKRLLISYEAILTDILGNTTYLYWYGADYTADSLFYGGPDTNANKNMTKYYLKEIDSAGNAKLTHWQALSYDGKLLRAFHQKIEDSIYGKTEFTRSNITYKNNNPELVSSFHEKGIGNDNLAYTSNRTNIKYNDKKQITAYHEEIITTQIDDTQIKTIIDAQFKYLPVPHQFGPDVEEPDPDRLSESIITTTTINPDGSKRTETTTTSYNYDTRQQLSGASGKSSFVGQEASWYEYTDSEGHILSRNKDEDGNVTYSYVNPQTLEIVIVPEEEVTITLKDGIKYSGTSEIQYEILYGKPMTSKAHSITSYYDPETLTLFKTEESTITYNNGLVNNLRRLLDTIEHTEISYPQIDPENSHRRISDIATTYLYGQKGNLIDAQGTGTAHGWEYSDERGFFHPYDSKITIKYVVILGTPLQEEYLEEKTYK